MLLSIIEETSRQFIQEAIASPTLMEDVAAMEKYMAESYGERILIELLQNADDAGSSRIALIQDGSHLYFANDGRPFSREDITGISRSGASQKQRGSSIGYRGVGFKSTSYLSERILIHSGGVCFTFSRETCARVLGLNPANVPTIRIPFPVRKDEVEPSIQRVVAGLVSEGFTTVFVFTDAKCGLIREEVQAINYGYFLFLNHLSSARLDVDGLCRSFAIHRERAGGNSLVTIEGDASHRWWVYHREAGKEVSLAFLLTADGRITACPEEEAVFHCYLPTLDKTGYPFKINSDFSTDPARKHLTMDDETQKALAEIASAVFDLVYRLVQMEDSGIQPEILELLGRKLSFSRLSMKLGEHVKSLLQDQRWVPLSMGERISPQEYLKEPSWLEPSEFHAIARHSAYVQRHRPPAHCYDRIPGLHQFLSAFSAREYQLEDWVEVLKEETLAKAINQRLHGKLLGHVMKQAKLKQSMRGTRVDLSQCLVPANDRVMPLQEAAHREQLAVTKEFQEGLKGVASSGEATWFDQTYATKFLPLVKSPEKEPGDPETPALTRTLTRAISKWRAAEQQCVELEEMWGNTAKDVSKQNMGYDVVSQTPEGRTRYIEVKLVGKNSRSFTLTNNEYSAAHQLEEDYHLCLIIEDEGQFVAMYIRDPIHTLLLEKRVRQWEWYCEQFTGEQYVLQYR